MSSLLFERVDEKSLFRVALTDVLGGPKPGFPTIRFGKYGYVLMHKGVALEITQRLITHVIARWPACREVLAEHINDPETGKSKGERDAISHKEGKKRRRKNGGKKGGSTSCGS